MENINSGRDYAKVLIDNIQALEQEHSPEDRIPDQLLEFWFEEIRNYANITWKNYIKGKREFYEFDEDEMRKLYERAGERYAGAILDGLVDRDLVQVGVREDGEIVYSLTEEGKKEAERIKGK